MGYKMSKQEKDILELIEKQTGFDVMNISEIKSRIQFIEAVDAHIKWFRGWAEEMAQMVDYNLHKLPWHFDTVTRKDYGQSRTRTTEKAVE